MKFLRFVLNFFAGLFAQAHSIATSTISVVKGAAGEVDKEVTVTVSKIVHIWDEKRFFGFTRMVLFLLLPFIFPSIDYQILGAVAAFGIALYIGVPIGDSVPFVSNLRSLGLVDMLTNKANQGDPLRLFGVLCEILAVCYLLAPLWNPQAQVVLMNYVVLDGVGVLLLWSAIFGDKVAVKNGVDLSPQ